METKHLDEIARRHGVLLIVEFGSSVSGRLHRASDRDLGVLFCEPRTFRALAELGHELQRAFPDREVDVAVLNRADPLFLKQVMERCRLVHGDPRRLQALRLYAFKRYQDHRRYLALEKVYVDRALGGMAR